MNLSPTCVLGYAMPSLQGCIPCILVICVVTSTSLQSSVIGNAEFRDLEFFSHFPDVIFYAMYSCYCRVIHASFEHVQ